MASELRCSAAQLQQCEKLIESYYRPETQFTQSPKDIWESLHEGLLVEGNKYFWVDDQDRLGVELFAEALVLPFNFTFFRHTANSCYYDEEIPIIRKIVKVLRLCEIRKDPLQPFYTLRKKRRDGDHWGTGRGSRNFFCGAGVEFNTRILTEGTEYEVLFDIEIEWEGEKWERCQVEFKMEGPFGIKNEFKMRVDQLAGAGRAEIRIGKFRMPPNVSEADTSITKGRFVMRTNELTDKHAIIVRGVVIKPVVYCKCSNLTHVANVRL